MTSHKEYGFCFLCTRKQTIGHLRPHRTLFRHQAHITTTTQIVHPPDDLIYLASRTRSSFTASQSTSIYYFIFHFSADEHQHSIAAAKIPKLSLSRGQQSCHKYCAIFIRDNHEQCPRRSLSIPWGRAGQGRALITHKNNWKFFHQFSSDKSPNFQLPLVSP